MRDHWHLDVESNTAYLISGENVKESPFPTEPGALVTFKEYPANVWAFRTVHAFKSQGVTRYLLFAPPDQDESRSEYTCYPVLDVVENFDFEAFCRILPRFRDTLDEGKVSGMPAADGMAAYLLLEDLRPVLAKGITNTEADPYMDDDNLGRFFDVLEKAWDFSDAMLMDA